jgi:hypothetical protein
MLLASGLVIDLISGGKLKLRCRDHSAQYAQLQNEATRAEAPAEAEREGVKRPLSRYQIEKFPRVIHDISPTTSNNLLVDMGLCLSTTSRLRSTKITGQSTIIDARIDDSDESLAKQQRYVYSLLLLCLPACD